MGAEYNLAGAGQKKKVLLRPLARNDRHPLGCHDTNAA